MRLWWLRKQANNVYAACCGWQFFWSCEVYNELANQGVELRNVLK